MSGPHSAGKGDARRPSKPGAYEQGYQAIDWRKQAASPQGDLFIVRLYDGFDNEWIDVSGPLTRGQADQLCGDKNAARFGSAAGKRVGSFDDIDYYAVFPTETKMLYRSRD